MKTAFSEVVAAVVAVLSADPAVCQHIYRARERNVPDQALTAVNVQFDGAIPNRGVMTGAPVDWNARISVECFARSVDEAGDEAVDPLLMAVYGRLAADQTLGGLVGDIGEPAIEAENAAEGKKSGWVRLSYNVDMRTQNLTLA